MDYAIRAASRADREGIISLFLDCWSASYSSVLPGRLVDAMDRSAAETLWDRALAGQPPGTVLLAEDVQPAALPEPNPDGRVVPMLGVVRFEPAGSTGLVHSLYVSPASQGRGVGKRLLAAAAAALSSAGCASGELWVFRDNAPARAFYGACGWLPDGESRVQPEFGEPEIRLQREFGPGHLRGDAT